MRGSRRAEAAAQTDNGYSCVGHLSFDSICDENRAQMPLLSGYAGMRRRVNEDWGSKKNRERALKYFSLRYDSDKVYKIPGAGCCIFKTSALK